MKSIKFSLTLDSPICCDEEDCAYQENFILPGSMIRGALANLYLSAIGKDQNFDSIFLQDNQFPFLFLANTSGEPGKYAPKTTMACKRKGKEHTLQSYVEDLVKPLPPMQCTKKSCGNDLKPFSGYLGTEKENWQIRFTTHTAIHTKTDTALPHALFREMLIEYKERDKDKQKKPDFCGYGLLSEQSYSILKNLCEQYQILLGKSRTRGKGWAKMSLEEKKPEISRKSLENKDYFTLHCLSPAIMLDEFLRPALFFQWKGKELKLVASQNSICSIRGWNVIQGLPKVEDIAIELGSVFLFQKDDSLKEESAFAQFIEEIEEQGIGERRIEGFGKVRINDSIVVDPKPGE
ncbi:MAG: hypothetical protein HUU50_08655 [Candidatus Brocadiae bacterium]|nr:hypothetical protein [Candidatus Brocadiia bacterium]